MRGQENTFLVLTLVFIICIGLLSFGQEDYTQEERQIFQKYKSLEKSFEKALDYYNKGKWAQSRKELKRILERMPEHSDAWFTLSQIAYKEGHWEDAMRLIQQAKENYRHIARVKLNTEKNRLLALREQREDLEMKWDMLEKKLANLPKDSVNAEQLRVQTQREIEGVKKDIEGIDDLLKSPPLFAEEPPGDYFYVHGNIYFKMKKFQEAHDQYQAAIRINPQYGEAYNNLAALYFQVKQYQKALDYIIKAEASGANVNPEFKKAILEALRKENP